MVLIVQKGHKVLRQIAKKVAKKEFGSPELLKLLKSMREALDAEHDGVALAAPQIGVSKRIFIVAPRVFEHLDLEKDHLIFINPEITKISKDRKKVEEGCLSVRPWYGKTRRASRASIKAYDENGNEFTVDGFGLLAQIFQHETDHLEGILFDDNATDLREIEELKK